MKIALKKKCNPIFGMDSLILTDRKICPLNQRVSSGIKAFG